MASPTDLPLRAFICTGCGWLNRGVNGQPPGGHAIQDAETQTYRGPCPGHWKHVIVYDLTAIADLASRFTPPQEPA